MVVEVVPDLDRGGGVTVGVEATPTIFRVAFPFFSAELILLAIRFFAAI